MLTLTASPNNLSASSAPIVVSLALSSLIERIGNSDYLPQADGSVERLVSEANLLLVSTVHVVECCVSIARRLENS